MGLHDAELKSILNGQVNHSISQKETLYKGYYGYLKGVVRRYVDDYHVTEELINDSFIKIFNNLASFRAPMQQASMEQSFKSWIARIASRTAIDFLRKKKIRFMEEEVAEKSPAGHRAESYSSEVKEILAMLDRLPQTQKTVFNLYEIEGFSHEEIGRMLGISENVCRVYLSRAKTKLKTMYLKHF